MIGTLFTARFETGAEPPRILWFVFLVDLASPTDQHRPLLQQGIVFDIQHYAIHDGPGIRTLVFLKGCPLKCLWCCNPESQRFAAELRHTGNRCHGCLACQQACPKLAVEASDGKPCFDREACSSCSAPCVDACPHGALALAGELMSPDQVIARIAADKAFYDNSGGGVTFSGGEPFAQPAFLEDLLMRSKRLGIHTAIETCGYANSRALARCEPLADLFLFDLKVMDRERHERLTGVSNSVILENLQTLAAQAPRKLAVRVPVIPGCTSDSTNLKAIAEFLRSLGLLKVQLMPYHNLGDAKYAPLGREYSLAGTQSLTAPALREAASHFHRHSIECECADS